MDPEHLEGEGHQVAPGRSALRPEPGWWGSLAARHRIEINRLVLVFVLVALCHPRSRIFFATGILIGLAGALLRIWARLTPVGTSLSLSKIGPYRMVRHPRYLGTALEACGIWTACLSFSRFFSFILLGLILAVYFVIIYKQAIVLKEEEWSLTWPAEWENYSQATPALLPTQKSLKELRSREMFDIEWRRLEDFQEWKNFLAYAGVLGFLWFKMVYKL